MLRCHGRPLLSLPLLLLLSSSSSLHILCLICLSLSLSLSPPLLLLLGWSKEQLLDAWMDSPQDACEKAGVQLPSNLGTHNMDSPAVGGVVIGGMREDGGEGGERECGVCVLTSPPDIEVPCGHFFCRDCWRQYLHQKIEFGDAHSIVCPEYGCFKLVPLVSIRPIFSTHTPSTPPSLISPSPTPSLSPLPHSNLPHCPPSIIHPPLPPPTPLFFSLPHPPFHSHSPYMVCVLTH